MKRALYTPRFSHPRKGEEVEVRESNITTTTGKNASYVSFSLPNGKWSRKSVMILSDHLTVVEE